MNNVLNLDTTNSDKVFEFKDKKVEDFSFNKQVVTVFDDMVSRSVPFYGEMQRMTAELAKDFISDGSNVYDIGCSTGTTLQLIDSVTKDKQATLIGLDNSEEMLKKAEEKLKEAGVTKPLKLEFADLNKGIFLENASFVTFILTLQFIRPLYR